MDAYLEITLRPDPEFGQQLLLDALMGKLHRGLVGAETNAIGVSFPRYSEKPRNLGDQLRLHGTADQLGSLMAQAWLTGMSDHLLVSDIKPAPAEARYRVVRRIQPKTNAERLRRRYQQRHAVSEEEVRSLIPDSVVKPVSAPFLSLRSASTGRRFALFVDHGPLLNEPVNGEFSSYGLSQAGTIPWF
ncbi:MAG: type I-F CRISPR-associated endoribonuclease Cas6/Csy4 [Gammaproteobacteria bacterium]|jgi:CRISPR-associated endonuclease Csy4|nr:type I-F CRISPR-associated endoribonuclease Cas6/Csy4 [Gammaproteobacteria bacterium]MBQ0774403.1 type I-F CRISPR-associated endoribonuclease Cas6/Csy4 [Gammaproteobacteria bacterium]|tara:strand:+ start:27780 stop:28343 length:564 start_codon:yes stop_codon:yes gene_type:complete